MRALLLECWMRNAYQSPFALKSLSCTLPRCTLAASCWRSATLKKLTEAQEYVCWTLVTIFY